MSGIICYFQIKNYCKVEVYGAFLCTVNPVSVALDAWVIFPGLLPMLPPRACLFLSALCHIMSEQWAHPNKPVMAIATPFSHIEALG